MSDIILDPQSFIDDFVNSAMNTNEMKKRFKNSNDLIIKGERTTISFYAASELHNIFGMWKELKEEQKITLILMGGKTKEEADEDFINRSEQEFQRFLDSFTSEESKKEIQNSTLDMYNNKLISKEQRDRELRLMDDIKG